MRSYLSRLGLFMLLVQEPGIVAAEPAPLRVGGSPPAKLLNIAHRGARGFAPENTLEAFAKGAEFGCHMFELDVHLSKDGELIVVHDDTLLRCSNVRKVFPDRKSWYVSDFTAAEIRKLDAGSWFVKEIKKPRAFRQSFLRSLTDEEIKQFISDKEMEHYAGGKVFHPTLRESLEMAQKHRFLVNIEIKSLPRMYPGIAKKVVDLVEEMKMEREVIVSSFDHEQLAIVRKRSRAIPTAALLADRLHNPGRYIRQMLDGDAYHPGCLGTGDIIGFHSVTGKVQVRPIRSARKLGLGVNVWTVNDPRQMRALIKAGVTGIFTDYPNRLREILKTDKGERKD